MKNISQKLRTRKLALAATLALLIVAGFGLATSKACNAAWSTEFSRASQSAKMAGRPILIIFLGSDWDEKSMTMEHQIFKNPDFGGYARLNFVLLKVDFPQLQLQTPEMQAANERLATEYKVHSFPTLLLVDDTGAELARTVYDGEKFPEFMTMMATLKQGAKIAQ